MKFDIKDRLWIGVAAVTAQWLLRYGVPLVAPEAMMAAIIGEVAGAVAVLVWWLFLNRAPRVDRWGALALMVAAAFVAQRLLDPSVAGGMMGMMFPIYAIPALCLALVLGAAGGRRVTLAAAILAACGIFTLLRTDGITGEGSSQFAWRWSKTSEQKLLAKSEPLAPAAPSRAAAPESGLWPGFRGPGRDGVVAGPPIATDWAERPPAEIWRRAVGPGWSSFAAAGGLVYTQEQRGDSEVTACYNLATGEPVWTHSDRARFWESNGGAGPRGTPAVEQGRVYSFGATGILNALDAATGAAAWTRNVAADTGTKPPVWGFSSSPLLVGDVVIAAAGGRLAAYERATGRPRWTGAKTGVSYSSAHRMTLGGVEQVVLLSADGATSVAPADGSVLWKHPWPGSAIVQPALTEDGAVLIHTGGAAGGLGTRRLAVARGPSGWTAAEVWTSTGLKPYFNDFVVHRGHAYGFDGGILSSIDLTDGRRKWKGGRYGHGQLLLLRGQDLLLVLSEEGEVALVEAAPGGYKETARFRALEGKTWNHPAVVGDVLLVRNGEEMAAFRLRGESGAVRK
jgi:outer membrane protein assembly factor BamB